MNEVDANANQSSLESLRAVQRRLYAIPDSELDQMSEADQTKYADSLNETSLAILKLEKAKLKGVNDDFKSKEKDLETATAKLEQDSAELDDAVATVQVISKGLETVTNIVKLVA